MKKSLLLALFGVIFALPLTADAADIQSELHYAFRVQCPPAPTADPLVPDATPAPAAEPCEPGIPFDAQKQAFVLTQAALNQEKLIDLFVVNPQQEMITSVRAKLKYDPTKMGVMQLDTGKSAFPLSAPGENDIDEDSGTITIGRSLTGGSRSDAEFFVGTLKVTPYVDGATLEFLNFQTTELADTGIYFTSGITAENRLPQAPKPLIIGGAASGTPTGTVPAQSLPPDLDLEPVGGDEDLLDPQTPPPSFPPAETADLRPTGLRVQTDAAGNVRLVWPIAPNPPVKGYYLYYGQKSGFYLRRRDVGRTNFAVFADLPKGQKYYFAITAYDTNDQESDYSDEVSVTIGEPGSESHGFTGDPRDPGTAGTPVATPAPSIGPVDYRQVDGMTDTGPEHVFFFLVISFGLAFVMLALRKRSA